MSFVSKHSLAVHLLRIIFGSYFVVTLIVTFDADGVHSPVATVLWFIFLYVFHRCTDVNALLQAADAALYRAKAAGRNQVLLAQWPVPAPLKKAGDDA